jgi:pseudouridine-5'-phosphate glycosidase
VGLEDAEMEHLARSNDVFKVSRRDLPVAVAQQRDGGTCGREVWVSEIRQVWESGQR